MTYYYNDPPEPLAPHAFRAEEVEAAGLGDDRTTEEPVRSVCGLVRAYGPFHIQNRHESKVCGNCKRAVEAADEDDHDN